MKRVKQRAVAFFSDEPIIVREWRGDGNVIQLKCFDSLIQFRKYNESSERKKRRKEREGERRRREREREKKKKKHRLSGRTKSIESLDICGKREKRSLLSE